MLQAVHRLEPGDRVKQLNLEGPQGGLAVQEEEVAAGAGVADGVLDEVHDGTAFEAGVRTETEVACKQKPRKFPLVFLIVS